MIGGKKYTIRKSPKIPTMKILSGFILIAATLMMASSSFTTNPAFATHLSEDLKWQLVVISSSPACSNFHYQMLEKYDEITEKYLELYQIQDSKYDPLCFTDEKYELEYTVPPDLDLIILVYDRNLGEKELHSQNMGGIYSHTGIDRTHNHAVIICGDCPTFYYSNPVWILSHELSHFVLYYKDFDLTVIEDLVHSYDKKYDQCLESYNDSCKPAVTKLRSQSYQYSVMPIYKPAIENNFAEKITNNEVSEVVLDLTKVITKWWAAGKITDGDYANAVGFVIDKDVISSHSESKILFADEPIVDEKNWETVISEITPEYWDRAPKVEDNTNEILSRVPDELKSDETLIYGDKIQSGLPDWFKNTANWWSEGKITDDEMLRSIEYLRDSGVLRPR